MPIPRFRFRIRLATAVASLFLAACADSTAPSAYAVVGTWVSHDVDGDTYYRGQDTLVFAPDGRYHRGTTYGRVESGSWRIVDASVLRTIDGYAAVDTLRMERQGGESMLTMVTFAPSIGVGSTRTHYRKR